MESIWRSFGRILSHAGQDSKGIAKFLIAKHTTPEDLKFHCLISEHCDY